VHVNICRAALVSGGGLDDTCYRKRLSARTTTASSSWTPSTTSRWLHLRGECRGRAVGPPLCYAARRTWVGTSCSYARFRLEPTRVHRYCPAGCGI